MGYAGTNGQPPAGITCQDRLQRKTGQQNRGIKNGTVEKTGTWDGNASTMTTSANFTGATYPLDLINGNWNITKNSWTYVEATQNIGVNTKFMRLDKL